MKVIIKDIINKKAREISIADAIDASIVMNDYDGELENIKHHIATAATNIGKIVEILYNRQLLTSEELNSMLSYRFNLIAEE